MQSLAVTKALLDTHISHVMENSCWLWNGNRMLEISELDTDKMSITTSDGITAHINVVMEQMKVNAQTIESSQRFKVDELRNLLSKLVKTAYDYNGAVKAVSALRLEGYNNALAKKPKKALYNMYTGKSSVTKGLQSTFNDVIQTGRFTPKQFADFGKAYLEGFEQGLVNKREAKEAKQKADRRCVDAIVNSYPGDVEELIAWLKEYATGVYIKAAREEEFLDAPAYEKCRAKALESIENTIDELIQEDKVLDTFEMERNTGMFNCWEVRLKPGHKEAAPAAVHEWVYDKKVPGDIDTYEPGTVYKSKLNKINGNPIVKDLVFNYGFQVGRYN